MLKLRNRPIKSSAVPQLSDDTTSDEDNELSDNDNSLIEINNINFNYYFYIYIIKSKKSNNIYYTINDIYYIGATTQENIKNILYQNKNKSNIISKTINKIIEYNEKPIIKLIEKFEMNNNDKINKINDRINYIKQSYILNSIKLD
jgi:hypothetical protein